MIRQPMREYRFSLRARATSWYVGLLAVALIVFSIGIYVGIRTYLKASLQRTLGGTAQTIVNDFMSKLPSKGEAWVLGEVRESYASTPTDHYVRISNGSTVFYRTGDMSDPSVKLDDINLPRFSDVGAFHRQSIDGKVVMMYSLPYRSADGRVFEVETGTSLFAMEQTMRSLAKILTIATVFILVFATIGGYLLMTQPLRPLVILTEKAAKIGRKELGERLPVLRTGDELERLTHSLNGMIDRLEEALNHNHRFSADASHELRTPLTIMRGEMEEMLRIENLPAQAVDNLVSTLDEIDRMSRIVNSLMVITRLDAGGERMDLETLNLSALVRTTVDHMQLLGEEKNLPITCACEREVLIHADPMRIKQVLVNLIDNAIKYTPGGVGGGDNEDVVPATWKHSASVDVAVYSSGDRANIRISDKGIGIASDVLPYVFDRFYRADYARSRGAGGVGLGLAIVKAIVTAHDGMVSITSTEGQGSTVLVQFPLAQPFTPTATEEGSAVRGSRTMHSQPQSIRTL